MIRVMIPTIIQTIQIPGMMTGMTMTWTGTVTMTGMTAVPTGTANGNGKMR